MIGVRFTKPVSPYGVGDTALLPEAVAQKIVDGGEGDLYEFPGAPHASEAVRPSPATKDMQADAPAQPRRDGRQAYRTKGRG